MNITPYFKIRKQGFTLIELLVAAAIGIVTTMTAGHVLTSQIDATQRINRKENLRNNWVKANKFITISASNMYVIFETSLWSYRKYTKSNIVF